MKSFEINGVKYAPKPFTYNTICDLEDMGVSLQDMQNKPMSVVRAYFAICTGKGAEFAGQQIEEHVIKGGDFNAVLEAMNEEMEKSDFFQALSNRTESNPTENEEAESKAKK